MKLPIAAPARFRFAMRVGISALAGVACISVFGFWLRSYSIDDYLIVYRISNSYHVSSMRGDIEFSTLGGQSPYGPHWSTGSTPIAEYSWEIPTPPNWLGFCIGDRFLLPHWFFVLVALMMGAAPWLRWRFTLRSVTIGLTIVAILIWLLLRFAMFPK